MRAKYVNLRQPSLKKTFITAVMFALICMLSVGLRVPWVAEANPIVQPTNELPTLTVQTPEPSSPYYAVNALELNFTVTEPQSWNAYQYGTIPEVGYAQIFLYLDGALIHAYPWTYNTVDQYSAVFTNLTQQQHIMWIDVWCFIEYDGSNASVSQTLTFTMDAQAQTITFHQDPVKQPDQVGVQHMFLLILRWRLYLQYQRTHQPLTQHPHKRPQTSHRIATFFALVSFQG